MAADATPPTGPAQAVGLGLDAGGTHTRWALADARGEVLAEGAVEGFSGTQLASADGQAAVQRVLQRLAAQVQQAWPSAADKAAAGWAGAPAAGQAAAPGSAAASMAASSRHPAEAAPWPCRVLAGVTGFGDEHRTALHAALRGALSQVPGLQLADAAAAVQSMPDIELSCRAAFPPGGGIVLLAGTGSIAACLGPEGTLQRAGGRGHLIDDAGSGHWIATRALRLVWRAEDAAPGSGQASLLGRALATALGGGDWPAVRAAVYAGSRGDIGQLALAVAEAAHAGDAQALALLQQAGRELARLVLALAGRLQGAGAAQSLPRPLKVALAGRVPALHPAIPHTLQAALPAGSTLQPLDTPAHHSAARLAAGALLP